MKHRIFYILIITGILAISVASGNGLVQVEAAPLSQENPPDPNISISNDVCLGCHGQPGQTMALQDGSLLDLQVPADAYGQSIHGKLGYACVQCHRNVGNYPHQPFQAADLRAAALQLNNTCQFCHIQQFEFANDSVHAKAMANGTREAAVCVDCHTAHDVRPLTDPQTHALLSEARVWIPQTCARCHSEIYEKYKTSVHGSALLGEGNPDVPTCIDCHGVHNIQDPTTASFRLSSPEMCAKCHTDSTIVGKYGLSTDVLNTYVADFHGTTIELFRKQHPDEQTNKPVCFDCHGIHDIARSDDPKKGLQVRKNLLVRCQECHPDASESFPAAWMSHYIPSPEKNPMVYYVNLFYQFFIPGVIGGMGVLVALDFFRLSFNRLMQIRRSRIQARATAALEMVVPAQAQAVEQLDENPVETEPAPLPGEEPAEAEAQVSSDNELDETKPAESTGEETQSNGMDNAANA